MPHLTAQTAAGRPGRRPATSHEQIAQVGIRLFAERGFDAVSVDDIAAAAGVGRRTLFRYYPSKNDIVWGTFDEHLASWERWIAANTRALDLLPAIRAAVVHFNDFDEQVMPEHRVRMALILSNPALQAHATLRYERWRAVIARMIAARLKCPADDPRPTVLAHLTLGAAISTYEQWLRDPHADLIDLMHRSFDILADPASIAASATTQSDDVR